MGHTWTHEQKYKQSSHRTKRKKKNAKLSERKHRDFLKSAQSLAVLLFLTLVIPEEQEQSWALGGKEPFTNVCISKMFSKRFIFLK